MPVTTTLQANALTNLAAVLDELGQASDGGALDSRLNRYINVASDFIERECGRIFRRQDAIVENCPGNRLARLKLTRRPILSLTAVVYLGTTYDLTDIAVVDADAGIILRRNGFPWTAAAEPYLSRRQVPGSEFPDVVVTYSGGYVTPKQVDDATFAPFAPRTLPSDLEDAAILLVTTRWRLKGVDPRARARSFEASGLTFGGEPVPPEIAAIIDHYRDVASA